MNFRAYDELRILGHSPEEAVKLAETYKPVGMYEEKVARDNGSHTRGNTRAIGLKPKYKRLIKR